MRQGRDRVLFAFAVDGKRVEDFAVVSRISRDEEKRIVGYQRPELIPHIAEIRAYLESANPMLPNPVVVAFAPIVRFEPFAAYDKRSDLPSVPGEIVIPLPTHDTRKAGWIVDGQQRLAAIREAAVKGFPVWVIGFVACSDSEQREQFILVNNTKPLPKGLVYELLPATETRLPAMLDKRRFPVSLLDRLNLDTDSPLKGRIKTQTMPEGFIKDDSLVKMIENSLSDGVLYRLWGRGEKPSARQTGTMLRVLKAFWSSVAAVFPDAWGKKPNTSRLLHGAGVIAMGLLMDTIADRLRATGIPTEEQFRTDLTAMKPVCRWTDGHWEFGPGNLCKWNEVQNTSKDIQVLANHLRVKYTQLVWNPSLRRAE
jgi:DGQHR domain-containing protein